MWVDAEKLEPATDAGERGAAWAALKGADAVLVPGGFGGRGVEGKILAAHHARTTNTPYLGICLGMQLAVIEYARNVLGLKDANSAEFDAATPHPTVVFMPEGSTTHKGGTMRLGSRRTVLETVDCIAAKLYQVSRGGREGGEGGWVRKKNKSIDFQPIFFFFFPPSQLHRRNNTLTNATATGTKSTRRSCRSWKRRACGLWAKTRRGPAWKSSNSPPTRGTRTTWRPSSTPSLRVGRGGRRRCSWGWCSPPRENSTRG